MSHKNSIPPKSNPQPLFHHNPTGSSYPTDNPNPEVHPLLNNPHGIFLTHQQKIQATYNFQSLFRKKSHIFNQNKNKKKLQNKNNKNQLNKNDDLDKDKNVKKGHWTQQQNRKYHWFLEIHNKHFILKHLRRTDKIFKAMSAFISTREAEQCRSHHQKMQKKYKNFYQIIIKLRMQFYGTCSTQPVKAELQENGYLKQGKDFLIQEGTLKSMQHTRQNLQSDSSGEKENGKKLDDDDLLGLGEKYDERSDENDGEEHKKEGNLFFGENYENELNYKLY